MKLYEIEGLRFTRGQRFTLRIEHLAIERGEKVAFVGQNGSGKTTLLRVLALLEEPDDFVRFECQEPSVRAGRRRPEGFGFLRQQPYLFRGSVRANAAYPLKLRGIPRAQAEARITRLFEQLDLTHLAQADAREISGGEQKRLALARVLVSEPTLLLLDEPVAHLDRQSQRVIEHAVLGCGATLLLTTHDLHLAHRLCDRVLTMRAGRLAQSLPENVFSGRACDGQLLTPGGLQIALPQPVDEDGPRVTAMVDPRSVVLSTAPLISSMRNHFPGRVCSVREEGPNVWVEVDCGERLTAIVSKASYQELGLNLHCEVVASFKAHAVEVL